MMDLVEIFTAICGLIQSVLIMFKRKENWIFYKKEDDISYEMKSSNWYPIINAKQFAKDVSIIEASNQEDIISYFKKNFLE